MAQGPKQKQRHCPSQHQHSVWCVRYTEPPARQAFQGPGPAQGQSLPGNPTPAEGALCCVPASPQLSPRPGPASWRGETRHCLPLHDARVPWGSWRLVVLTAALVSSFLQLPKEGQTFPGCLQRSGWVPMLCVRWPGLSHGRGGIPTNPQGP